MLGIIGNKYRTKRSRDNLQRKSISERNLGIRARKTARCSWDLIAVGLSLILFYLDHKAHSFFEFVGHARVAIQNLLEKGGRLIAKVLNSDS
jgi:hypothetical protein